MANLMIVINNKKRVPVASQEAAQAEYAKYAKGKSLRASTFIPMPLIDLDAKKVLGYFSMNGRYWPAESMVSDFDRETWKTLTERFFNNHL